MGMAERGRVFPGWIALDGPEVMVFPGRTPAGARMYEKPFFRPAGDSARSQTA